MSNRITINGVTIESDGGIFAVQNGRMFVDGNEVTNDKGNLFFKGNQVSKDRGNFSGKLVISIEGDVKNIEVEDAAISVTGSVDEIKTVSGDIKVDASTVGQVSTMSGDITIKGEVGKASSMSGDVRCK